MPVPGRGGVVPRGTAVPTGSLPSRGRAYVGTPSPPGALPGVLFVRPLPSPVRRPRSPLGTLTPLLPPPRELPHPPLSAARGLRGAEYPLPPVEPARRPEPPPRPP